MEFCILKVHSPIVGCLPNACLLLAAATTCYRISTWRPTRLAGLKIGQFQRHLRIAWLAAMGRIYSMPNSDTRLRQPDGRRIGMSAENPDACGLLVDPLDQQQVWLLDIERSRPLGDAGRGWKICWTTGELPPSTYGGVPPCLHVDANPKQIGTCLRFRRCSSQR